MSLPDTFFMQTFIIYTIKVGPLLYRCPSLVSIAVIETMTKISMGRRGLTYCSSLPEEAKAETEAVVLEECCSLACSSWLNQSAFIVQPRTPVQFFTIHNGLDPPLPIVNKENTPQTCLKANLIGSIFSTEFFSSLMMLDYDTTTKTD